MDLPLCECGCGERVSKPGMSKPGNRFIKGHSGRGKHWSDSESAFLKENYPRFGGKLVAQELGRTLDSIYHQARRLGIGPIGHIGKRKRIGPEEVRDELRPSIDFGSQRMETAGGRTRLSIRVTCPDCGLERVMTVSHLRHLLKTRWSGCCHKCVSTRTGERSHSWKGGYGISPQGYRVRHSGTFGDRELAIIGPMMVLKRKGRKTRILEHRAVVALALGRPLKADEIVHHINRDRADNRLENLQLVDHHNRPICPHCGWRIDKLAGLT